MRLQELFEENEVSEYERRARFWLRSKFASLGDSDIEIDEKGLINVLIPKNLYFHGLKSDKLPFKFGKVRGTFSLNGSHITTLEGIPTEMPFLDLQHCTEIESLVGIDKLIDEMDNTINMGGYPHPVINLRGMKFRRGGLGLVNIKGLGEILYDEPDDFKDAVDQHNMKRALSIINEFIGRPEDIFECQAELIEAGLEAFAEL